jgi:hypothetical protein
MNVRRLWTEEKRAPPRWGGVSPSKIKAARKVNFSRVDACETSRHRLRKVNASSRTSGRVDCPIFGGRAQLENEKIIAIWSGGGSRHGRKLGVVCGEECAFVCLEVEGR